MKEHSTKRRRIFLRHADLSLLVALAASVATMGFVMNWPPATGHAKVVLMKTPDDGIQPQAVTDKNGVAHLIYFKGSPEAGDIFCVRKQPGAAGFSRPVRVNSVPGSVIAIGSVRGAQIAVGKAGIIHVAWLGSEKAEPRGPSNATPMLYTRSNARQTAFEPERNVMQFATGLDGGGSVAADDFGRVYVAWHGNPSHNGETNRQIWIARSTDQGTTFSREIQAYSEPTGACGCCGMRVFADHKGDVYVLYRAATQGIHRDMYLLVSRDKGKTFQGAPVDRWELNACPMSTDFISDTRDHMLIAWERAGQVYYTAVRPGSHNVSGVVAAPGDPDDRKHPVVVGNQRGDTLLVWTEGTAWQRGGSLAWQLYDESGEPTEKGHDPGAVPIWGLVTAFDRPDGGFTIVY